MSRMAYRESSILSLLTMADIAHYMPKPDPDFNGDHNKAVVQKTMAQYEAKRKQAQSEFDDMLGERVEAVGMYLRAVDDGKAHRIEDYFGPRYLAELRAQRIFNKVKQEKESMKRIILSSKE